jgi:hypothetical protein
MSSLAIGAAACGALFSTAVTAVASESTSPGGLEAWGTFLAAMIILLL